MEPTWYVTKATGKERSSRWRHLVDTHPHLTPAVKAVLTRAILEVKDVKGHLLDAWTAYAKEPEAGAYCHDAVHVFADGRWAILRLHETRKGHFGRDSTTYVRCAPEVLLETSDEWQRESGLSLQRYDRLRVLKEAGLLTETDIAAQRAYEDQCFEAHAAENRAQVAAMAAEREARTAQRKDQEFRRMLKQKGRAAVLKMLDELKE